MTPQNEKKRHNQIDKSTKLEDSNKSDIQYGQNMVYGESAKEREFTKSSPHIREFICAHEGQTLICNIATKTKLHRQAINAE